MSSQQMNVFTAEPEDTKRKTPRSKHKNTPKTPREKRLSRQKERELDRKARDYEQLMNTATPAELQFRHSHWWQRREKVIAAHTLAGWSERKSFNFRNCGAACTVEWSEKEQRHRLRGSYCKNRHCEPCMRAKAGKIRSNLQKRLSEHPGKEHRFITLTLAHTDDTLAAQIKRLYTSFRKLRSTKLWKRSQDGGAFMLEVKKTDSGWHPHLHIISEGRWINAHELSLQWKTVTGDSFIVDVRMIHRDKDVAGYICKYISKSTSPTVWNNDDDAREWIAASKGVRICSTYGNWRGCKLSEPSEDPGDWEKIGELADLINRARAGNDGDFQLLLKLRPPGETDADLLTAC